MKKVMLEWLACPACAGALALPEDAGAAGDDIASGELACQGCRARYPVVGGIPRFVPSENYAASFGFQWNSFARTQLDSANGTTISSDRFIAQSGWSNGSLAGKLVLDGGSGSGRFAEVALALGATLVALDYSSAIDALAKNFRGHPRLHFVQGNLLALPFKPAAFDCAYSFGVLQHTPDAKKAVAELAARLKPGGTLAVDIYRGGVTFWTHPRFWLRPFTTRLAPPRLFRLVQRAVPALLPLSDALGRLPVAGRALQRLVPVANYRGRFSLSEDQLREWAVLDTFDWLSPRYDRPASPETLGGWLKAAGLVDVEVSEPVMVTARGRKP